MHPMSASPSADEAFPDLAAKLQFLRAHVAPGEVAQCIETRMSWVFLAGDRVLKLKKPLSTPVLDFSTLAAREFNCREELRLNARLAPGVYLGLLALQWDGHHLSLGPDARLPGNGRTVDWLVLMKRLPVHRMLDQALADGQVAPADIDELLAVLAPFYRKATVAAIPPEAYADRFRLELALHREVLLDGRWRLAGAAQALDGLASALARHRGLLLARAARQRLVEGHGDLKPEHVCLLHPPVVIDCLEFSPALRQVDPFDEIAFLGLECTMGGAPWVGRQLAHGCSLALGDAAPAPLMHLYTAHRALLRARQAIAHLHDPVPRTPLAWVPRAERYIGLASSALDALNAARPVVTGPTPGGSR